MIHAGLECDVLVNVECGGGDDEESLICSLALSRNPPRRHASVSRQVAAEGSTVVGRDF